MICLSRKGLSVRLLGVAASLAAASMPALKRLGGCAMALVGLLGAPALVGAQSTYTWNGPSGGAWLNPVNWSSGLTYPGVTAGGVGGADGNANDTALINIAGIASIGIDMGANGGLQSLGAIDLTGASGSLAIGNLSTTTAGTLQLNGAMLNSVSNVLLADTTTSASTLTIQNTQGSGNKTLALVLGVNYGTMLVSSGNTIAISSIISDGGNGYGFTLQGGGNLTLSGVNTYSGVTTIAAGKLTVGVATSLQFSTVNLGSSGALVFGSIPTTATFGGLAGTGALNLTNTASTPAAVTLTIGKINVNSSETFIGVIGGLGGLTKTGNGMETLTAANTFTGAVTITQGFLSVTVLANGLQASGIGESSNAAANLAIGGGLQYTGAGASTDRLFTFTTGFSTLDASGAGALVFTNNGIAAGKAAAATTLTLTGSTTAANTLSPVIADGGAGGTAGLTKYGSGTWALAAANTYSGATSVLQGTLVLDFASSYETTNPTSNIINSSTQLHLGGGTLSLNGKNGQTNSQTFSSVTIYPGTSAIAVTANGATVDVALAAISRSGGNGALAGTVVDFPTTASLNGGTITTTTANASNAILGGYATVGGTTWAVSAGNGTTAGAITGLAAYGSLPASGVTTTDVDGGGNVSAAATIDSLRFNGTGPSSLTIAGANVLTIASGGILMTSNASSNVTISGGKLTSTASDFDVIQNSASATLTISAQITGGSNGQFTKAGPGTLILTNTTAGWSNNTFFDGGVLSLPDLAAWHGGLAQTYSVFSGGTLQYTGSGGASGTTTRGFTVLTGGAILDASGTGALVFSSVTPSGTATNLLNITGASTDPGYRTLTLTGSSAGGINNTFSWVVPNAYQSPTYLTSVLKTGSNTWVLNAGNTYTGGTTVSAGALSLDFSTGNSAFFSVNASTTSSVTVSETGTQSYTGDLGVGQAVTGAGVPAGTTITAINGANLTLSQAVNVTAGAWLSVPLANNILAAGSSVTLAGGTLSIKAAASGTSTQTIGNFTLAANTNDTLTLNPNGASLSVTLAFLVRDSGSALNINSSSGATIFTSGGTADALLTDANGTAYAVFNGNDWAAKSATSPTIVGVSTLSGANGYTADSWAAGNNTDVTLATNTIAAGSTTGRLRFNSGDPTINLSGTNQLTSGGILVTAGVGSNLALITGGTLKGPSGGEFVIFQNNPSGNLQLDTVLADGSASTGLTVTGGGTVILSQANTYTGQTTILQGTLVANNTTGSATGAGGVVVNSAGTLAGAGTISGPVTVSGGTIRGGVSNGDNNYATLTIGNSTTVLGGSAIQTEVNRNTAATSGNLFVFAGTSTTAGNASLISTSGTFNLGSSANHIASGSLMNINILDTNGNLTAGESYTFNLVSAAGFTLNGGAASGLLDTGSGVTGLRVNNTYTLGAGSGDVANVSITTTNSSFANSITSWQLEVSGSNLELLVNTGTPTPEPQHLLLICASEPWALAWRFAAGWQTRLLLRCFDLAVPERNSGRKFFSA